LSDNIFFLLEEARELVNLAQKENKTIGVAVTHGCHLPVKIEHPISAYLATKWSELKLNVLNCCVV